MATRWLLLAYLSCTAWSYVIGPRDVARPKGPAFRLMGRVAPEGALARDEPPGRTSDLETRNATAFLVSDEEACRRGFPGLADGDEDPGRSRRARDELVEILTKRAVNTITQSGTALFECPIMGQQTRTIDFVSSYDDTALSLTVKKSSE